MKIELIESSDLYKGIFWIIDTNNPYSSKDYCFTIPSDLYGNPILDDTSVLNAKNGTTYNHEKVWNQLDTKLTRRYPFNYFLRGRVEISNSKATIYCSPYIADNEECIDFIVDIFNLNSHNNIKKVRVIADGSDHYKCYLDT